MFNDHHIRPKSTCHRGLSPSTKHRITIFPFQMNATSLLCFEMKSLTQNNRAEEKAKLCIAMKLYLISVLLSGPYFFIATSLCSTRYSQTFPIGSIDI